MGIGGVKVELQVPGHVSKQEGLLEGKVVLTSKSDQELVNLTVILKEQYTTGRGDDKQEKEYELGKVVIPYNMQPIRSSETIETPFSLTFRMLKSDNDELKEKGGALGTIGKLGAFANNERSEFFVTAEVDVKSAALDPTDKKDIKLL